MEFVISTLLLRLGLNWSHNTDAVAFAQVVINYLLSHNVFTIKKLLFL